MGNLDEVKHLWQLPLDIIPLKAGAIDCAILDAIAQGEVIYER